MDAEEDVQDLRLLPSGFDPTHRVMPQDTWMVEGLRPMRVNESAAASTKVVGAAAII